MQSPNAKKVMAKIIASQPEDASYEEIMKELSFERMIERGMEDIRKGRVITSKEMERRLQRRTYPNGNTTFKFSK